MKTFFRLVFASLFAILGASSVRAQTSEFDEKIISLGGAATSLETNRWYVIFNAATNAYIVEGPNNTLGVSTSSPNGTEATASAGYLVRLEEADDGKYYFKTGLGNYYNNVTNTKNYGTTATAASRNAYDIMALDTEGLWTLRCNSRYFLRNSNGVLTAVTSPNAVGNEGEWAFLPVNLSDLSSLTGQAYVNYVLNNKNLVRLTNRRRPGVRLAAGSETCIGAAASNSSLAQVWIVSKSGAGYTLRNGNTGSYLSSDNDFRTPSGSPKTLYIQFSPNNGTNDAYINVSERSDFSGLSCLNLGNDGTTLYKWSCLDDSGSDWNIAVADNFTLEDVEADLLAQSGCAEPAAGKYFRIKNTNRDIYINENFASNILSCEAKDEEKLSQYWTLVRLTNGTWLIQNVCTQRYVSLQNGTLSTQYRTSTSKPSSGFTIQRTNDTSLLNYFILDTRTVGLHCDAGCNVVGWTTDNDNSVWAFEEAELDDDFIAEGRGKLDNYAALLRNFNAYKASLSKLFQDNACTILKEDIQEMTDEELAANENFASLNADIQAMVLKVKNNTWQSFTSSSGYSRQQFERFFRIRDDFFPYSHYQLMAGNQYAGMSYSFGRLSGPTGIVGKTGDIIYIYLDEEPSKDCLLQAEVVMDSESPGDHQTGSTTTLHAGLNAVLLGQPSTLYIFYQLNDPEKYIADYPAAKIHIEGGQLQGYFDYTRGMTNEDWTLLCERLLDKSNVINLKCDRLVFAMLNQLVQDAAGRNGNMEGLMRIWNNFVECEEDLMGFKEDLQGRYRNVWNAFSVNHGYMYATTYGTYYSDGTIPTVMNYDTMTSSSGAIWGPSHEIGHNHQACFNIVGATEVSNNLFSNVNVFLQGVSTTRGARVTETLNDFASGTGWFGMDIWEQTRFYFQLYLYFHAQGHKPDFYPTLFKLLRQDPIRKRSNTYDSSLQKNGVTVGGYLSYGRQDYLHMAKKMCDAAQLDLSELFEVNGMFVPYNKYYLDDYGDYWVTTTQQDIDEAKAYMARYPKAPSICFIDDRIKLSASISDGLLEGKPKSAYRVAYDVVEAPIGYADVGQWTDFINDYQTNGYYYGISTSQGTTTYTIYGSGAIGFKVYDKEGNLIYLSNEKRFTIPSYVPVKMADGFKIVACEANGYEVLVPYGPSLNRGEMIAYYEGNPTPHTLYYYGTGTAGVSEMNPLPANSIAFVKAGQTDRKQPTEELLANTNVVGPDNIAQSIIIDGDKPFFIPADFMAQSLTFTKSGEGYQALCLPFDTHSGGGIVGEDGTVNPYPETFSAGSPILFLDNASIAESDRQVHAGTYAETESGYIYDGTSFVYAENISPFTYVWDNPDGIREIPGRQQKTDDMLPVYNIAGQRVSKPSKGIYIVGGRKIMLK